MANDETFRRFGDFLGYGEKEGQLSEEEFLTLYPDGVFKPTPPSWVEVQGVMLPPAIARALVDQQNKSG